MIFKIVVHNGVYVEINVRGFLLEIVKEMNEAYMNKVISYIKKNRYPCMCIGTLVAVLFVIYRMIPPVMD